MFARSSIRNAVVFSAVLSVVAGTRPALGRVEDWKLTPSDAPEGGEGFGRSVAIDGEYLVVGAPFDDDHCQDSGAAYVFKREGETWVEQAKLTASQVVFDDGFGAAVGISGDFIVVGQPGLGPGSCTRNMAYFFRREGDTWIEEASFFEPLGCFGSLVAISGRVAVIGRTGGGSISGAAYVYRRHADGWGLEEVLIPSAPEYVESVGVSGNVIAVGVPGHEPAGAVHVFRYEGAAWVQEAVLTTGEPEDAPFGYAVSVYRDQILLGDPYNDQAGTNSGAAYVFRHNGTTWLEEARLTAHDADRGDKFGSSVAIAIDLALIGAPEDDDYCGGAYIFRRTDTGWIEEEKLATSDPGRKLWFGFDVAMTCENALVGGLPGGAYLYSVSGECLRVPTVSEWGTVVVALVLLVSGTLVIRHRSAFPRPL